MYDGVGRTNCPNFFRASVRSYVLTLFLCDKIKVGAFMDIEFEVSDVIPAPPEVLFTAWLDSETHAKMTESPAAVSNQLGESFEAGDGYIQGKNLELQFPTRILQSWRTSEFKESDKDSVLEILFAPEGAGTRITIRHSLLPEHGMQYKQGWIDYYLMPMKRYFGKVAV